MDGVVRAPSAFSITRGWAPSITATQEFVVPRSIPMTLPMTVTSSSLFKRTGWPRSGLAVTPDEAAATLRSLDKSAVSRVGGYIRMTFSGRKADDDRRVSATGLAALRRAPQRTRFLA
ncbi:hypothetical protein GCM10008179_23540 [Hansschlegelia plantiphila]|uniref:Uncharacterized protein n=1 Tax=Hansschlegelia plantiphila TaxID=374655 RepID=A0A9W6J0T8_9HYPH|nr:hypothetical protein GCM10008179_23540 [Hansschlegelia plantiphila]